MALLARLACEFPVACSREMLADTLWPDLEPAAGRERLKRELTSLRRQLETEASLFLAERGTLALNPVCVTTDLAEFRQELKRVSTATTPSQLLPPLEKALQQFQQPLLPELYEEWVLLEQLRLSAELQAALAHAVTRLREWDCPEVALRFAAERVALAPLNVAAHQERADLLEATGHRTAAEQSRQELEQLLTATPHPASTRRVISKTQIAAFGLSAPMTRFFGREQEQRLLSHLLEGSPDAASQRATPRLITLLGPGGCGKTRLMLETLRERTLTQERPCLCVGLAELTQASQLSPHLTSVLPVAREGTKGAWERLTEFLCGLSPVLLALDNLEHLLQDTALPEDDTALWIGQLLEQVPGLTLLVTSRRPIGWEGESLLPLLPLACPVVLERDALPAPESLMQYPALALFVDRAQAVQPDFRLTSRNAHEVVSLCTRLDGLPLALEMAASWVHALPLSRILDSAESPLALPVRRQRHHTPRHRSLQDTFEGSFRLLPPKAQHLLQTIALFPGGITLSSLQSLSPSEEATTALPELLETLISHSLLQCHEEGEVVRYRMLVTIRTFCLRRMPSTVRQEAEKQVSHCLLQLVQSLEIAERTQPEIWHGTLLSEQANLRLALEVFLREGEIEAAAELSWRLSGFWMAQANHTEARYWFDRLLEQHERLTADWLWNMLERRGRVAHQFGDTTEAHRLFQEALSLGHQQQRDDLIGPALAALCFLSYTTADFGGVTRYVGELEARGLAAQQVSSLQWQAEKAQAQGDWHTARNWYRQALEFWCPQEAPEYAAYLLQSLGVLETLAGNYREATAALEFCREAWERYQQKPLQALTLRDLGGLAAVKGEIALARTLLCEAWERLETLPGQEPACTDVRAGLALLDAGEGRFAEADTTLETCLAFWQRLQHPRWIATTLRQKATVALWSSHLEVAHACAQESRQLYSQVGDRYGVALVQTLLGQIATHWGDTEQAIELLTTALSALHSIGAKPALVACLEAWAELSAVQLQPHRVVTLFSAAETLRGAIGPLSPAPHALLLTHLQPAFDSLSDAERTVARLQGRHLSLDAAVQFALSP